jgi:hypothetical protein
MSNSCRWSSVTPAKGNRFASRYAFARTASSARTTASAISLASDTRTFTQFGAPPSGVNRSSSRLGGPLRFLKIRDSEGTLAVGGSSVRTRSSDQLDGIPVRVPDPGRP